MYKQEKKVILYDIRAAFQELPSIYNLLSGDFNTKPRIKEAENGNFIEEYGYGLAQRKSFMNEYNLYSMNFLLKNK